MVRRCSHGHWRRWAAGPWGGSGGPVVSLVPGRLPGLVVSVVSSSPRRLLLVSSRIWPVQALLTGAPTNQTDNQWEHPGSDQWGCGQ